MAKFEKLRVSLAREDTGPLLEEFDSDNEHMPRSVYLAAAFSEERRFLSDKNNVYQFHPIDAPAGFAAGFFSREKPHILTHADLSPYVAENYETTLMVISLDKDQIIWMEHNTEVGSTKRILESFFSHLLRKTTLKDWTAYIRYFDSYIEYWDAVQKYRDEITKIIFRYVPPNAFEGRKLAQQYHTAVQQEAGSESLEETFKGARGKMNPESEMMQANAEIAAQGAGERELRGSGNKLLYKSGQGRVTEVVPDDDMPDAQHQSFLQRVIARLFP